MRVKRLFVTIAILFSLLFSNFSQAQGNRPIDFPDIALRAKIAEALGKGKNAVITGNDMLALTELHAPNANIRNLASIQHARNLKKLYLGGEYIKEEQRYSYSNAISDLSPIQGLTQLTFLDISGNDVSNLSALSGLTALTTLRLYNNSISDISALKGLTQLTLLDLWNNSISDISALKGLTQLTYLDLWNNSISDISALKGLTQLRQLYLIGNAISDISALEGLTQLRQLHLTGDAFTGNAISDISALEGLTQLTALFLGSNAISDISPLKGLTQLTVLDLGDNAILDVSPLVGLDLSGTEWNSTGLYIDRNPLSYASINTHIPAVQAKGVEVNFDARVPTTLLKISDPAQEGVVNTALPFPFVVEVLDEKNQVFAGVPVTFTVTSGGGRLSTKTVKADVTGRAATRLTLGQTVGTTTVGVTATDISQPVQFTAMAILRSAPVMIPDANLRMKIMETLRKPIDETPTASDMLKLTTLTANNVNIRDLIGLQYAVNLTRLSLDNNRISNVSPLVGLTQLTTLNLRNNRLSDVLPLVSLAQLNGSKDWHDLYLQGNPLSDISIDTHIPMLQAAGVNVHFDSALTQQGPIVRLIYFRPRDRQPRPGIDVQMDRLIKDVQQFYADQMEAHGFGRKTFELETDTQGNAVVYHIHGKFDDGYYRDKSGIVWREIDEQFDRSKDIYFTVLDSTERIRVGEDYAACGTGGGGSHGGSVLIPAFGTCFNLATAAHELGHACGLQHDFRDGSYIMSYGPGQNQISQCTAEWLDVQRAFNVSQATPNQQATFEMLPPSLASPPNAIRFRFEVNDPDGLHQVQLFTPTLRLGSKGSAELVSYKRLNGTANDIVEFVTTVLGPANESVSLQVIDKSGYISGSRRYSIDVASLLPPSKVVSIPDPNLAAALRQEIGPAITTNMLLSLTHLDVPNRGITDLTGLEHAQNLRTLDLGGEHIGGYIEENGGVNSNAVSDFSPLESLMQLRVLDLGGHTIEDVSPLAGLTQLKSLDLSATGISDISPLAGLIRLTDLKLGGNTISDIAPLAGLTQLNSLSLQVNTIEDVSPLTGLIQLTDLKLGGNTISDIAPLAGLTQLTDLSLGGNTISDIAPLTGLTQLTDLNLWNNTIKDVSPLTGLIQLTDLKLGRNTISDIAPLAGLTQLTDLNLGGNYSISDISALAGLTQLILLDLRANAISDVSPLVELNLTGTEWWRSTGLYIEGNPLSYASLNTHIPAMQANGIEVKFDDRAHSAFMKISGDAQEGEAGKRLPTPFVVEATDPHGAPMTGLSVRFRIFEGAGHLSAPTVATDANGRAQTTLTLGRNLGVNKVNVTAVGITSPVTFTAVATEATQLVADVNGDGTVNIQDLVLVSSNFGKTGENNADVNDDGVVNISDLVLVASAFGEGAAAAPTLQPSDLEGLTAAKIQDLLTQARQMALTDPTYLRGIAVLEQLLTLLLPKETALLPNYPNPFNPETWIPYHLSKPAEVTLHIYTVNGALVRTLVLGHQAAGKYQTRTDAAYWDGRNAMGETVASGIYFYTLTAGDFTATRKMLIRK